MRNSKPFIFLLILLGSSLHLYSQSSEWTKETSDDGKISVSYTFYESAKKEQIIEYIATTTTQASYEKCIAVLKNADLHKNLSEETTESKRTKTVSNTEWYIYYYIDAPWPIPNSDCAIKVLFTENQTKTKATFHCTAAPNSYEKKDVQRMTYYDVIFTVEKLPNNSVKISVHSKMTPVVSAPEWLLSSWFPEGATDNIALLISESKKLK